MEEFTFFWIIVLYKDNFDYTTLIYLYQLVFRFTTYLIFYTSLLFECFFCIRLRFVVSIHYLSKIG